MRIELLSLVLNHFKGVEHFELTTNGQDAIISGSNGSGKTSTKDAWLWLLFDMDGRGAKGAEAAKTTAGTEFVHYLTHEVSGIISVDGKQIKLRKTLEEKWTKKRGEETQTFSGNVSNYINFEFIDLLINKEGIPEPARHKRLMEIAYEEQQARQISLFEMM